MREIYSLTQGDRFKRDYSLVDQIRRAGISVMSNIAEGYERKGKNDRSHFMDYAKGSCSEIRAQLIISKDMEYISENNYAELDDKCDHILRMLENLKKFIKEK